MWWSIFNLVTIFEGGAMLATGIGWLILFVAAILLTSYYPWLWTIAEWGLGIICIAVIVLAFVAYFVKDKDEHYGFFGFLRRLFQ